MLLQLCGQRLDGGLKLLLFNVGEGTFIVRPRTLSRLNRMAQENSDSKRSYKAARGTAHDPFSLLKRPEARKPCSGAFVFLD